MEIFLPKVPRRTRVLMGQSALPSGRGMEVWVHFVVGQILLLEMYIVTVCTVPAQYRTGTVYRELTHFLAGYVPVRTVLVLR